MVYGVPKGDSVTERLYPNCRHVQFPLLNKNTKNEAGVDICIYTYVCMYVIVCLMYSHAVASQEIFRPPLIIM